jgi:hypothetical protein
MTAIVYFALFLLLGAVVSLEDWREKKIRNRWIVLGAAACAAGMSWFLGNSVLGLRHLRFFGMGAYYLPWDFYPRAAVHLLLSLAAAVVLWWLSVWPAGDAKFFTLLSFFAVLVEPNLPGFPQLLFLLLLVNIFVPAGLLFAVETLVLLAARAPRLWAPDGAMRLSAELDRLRVRAKELWPYRYDYLMLLVNLFAMFILVQRLLQLEMPALSRFASGPWISLGVFVVISVVWKVLSELLRNKIVGILSFAGVCVWTLGGAFVWHWDVAGGVLAAVKMTANFWVFLSFGRGLFVWLIERESLREALAGNLRHGVVLSDDSWNRIGSESELTGRIGERYSDGITDEDAATLRGWLETKGIATLSVYQTIPFALWIFFGTLLTVSSGCNVVAVLAVRFQWALDALRAAAPRGLP